MRKLWIVLGIVLVVVVGGFVAVYLAFFNNDSPPPLTLSSTGTTVAGAPTIRRFVGRRQQHDRCSGDFG